jgi:hypothetical protein
VTKDARSDHNHTTSSTFTRNFPNRLGKNSNVYLGSAELAAICSKLGRIPTKEEYLADMGVLTAASDTVYQYLNFDKIVDYTESSHIATAHGPPLCEGRGDLPMGCGAQIAPTDWDLAVQPAPYCGVNVCVSWSLSKTVI